MVGVWGNRKLERIVLLAFLALPLSFAFGVDEYYSLSRSFRAMGMGGAFYGLSDDENAVFYNPAGLAFRPSGIDLMGSIKLDMSPNAITAASTFLSGGSITPNQLVTDLQAFQGSSVYVDVNPLYFYYVRKYFAAGLLLADTKTNIALLGLDLDSSLDFTVLSDSGLFVSFAYPLDPVPGLALGATLKGLFRAGGHQVYTALDMAEGTPITTNGFGMGGGIDADLGATYELPEIFSGITTRASLVMNNVFATQYTLITSSYGPPPGLPRMLTLAGMMQFPGFWKVDHVNLLLDFAEFGIGGQTDPDLGGRGGSFLKHVNFGAEAPLWGWLYTRLGFHQGNFCAGIGIDAQWFQLDFATYAEELGLLPGRLTSRRIALRLAAGLGGENPKPVPAATSTAVPDPATPPGQQQQPQEDPKLGTAAPASALPDREPRSKDGQPGSSGSMK